ncbi:MAG TPA: glycosyltransferase [Albitalea sp.]|uniref:glycosyltransferase family 2 protein n=1 Tax=Piscinibacter sp. TaxID=1903157 RepID=UPI002ED6147D
MRPMTPRISVVIPTFRRPGLLARCLSAVLAQHIDADGYEVIVVDDGHDDATRAVVERLQGDGSPALRYLRPAAGRGPAVARNAGWRVARGALVAFTDDDTIPDRRWLAEGEQDIGTRVALCGRVVVPPLAEPPTDHELMTRGLASAEFVTANAFVWREALERVGGFDERFRRAWREDSDLQFRLAELGDVARSERAAVIHPVRPEGWGVCLRQQRNVFFDALLYKKHPRHYRERIRPRPPWDHYLVVGLALAALALSVAGRTDAALPCAAGSLLLMLRIAAHRLRHTARTPSHVAEMIATSALIPFLSVYWRLRGALSFRVPFF